MRNQVAAAERAGIIARTINSANMHEWDKVGPRSPPAPSTCCWSAPSG